MFGENINRIRESKSMGLNETARRAGISGSYLSDIEKGIKKNPGIETLYKIAEALGVKMKELVSDNDINLDNISSDVLLDQELMWAYLIKAADQNATIRKTLDQALSKDNRDIKLSSVVIDFVDKNKGTATAIKYDFLNNTVSRYDEMEEAEKREDSKINTLLQDGTLNNKDILTLAAHMFGHEGPLTEEMREKITLAMKIALAKYDK